MTERGRMATGWMHEPRWIEHPALYLIVVGAFEVWLPWLLWEVRAPVTGRAGIAFLSGVGLTAAFLAVHWLVFCWRSNLQVELILRPDWLGWPRGVGIRRVLWFFLYVAWFWTNWGLMHYFGGARDRSADEWWRAFSPGVWWYLFGAATALLAYVPWYWRKVWNRAWDLYRERLALSSAGLPLT